MSFERTRWIVVAVQNGRLKADANGRITLPEDMPYIDAPIGRFVYLTTLDHGRQLILFPTREERFGLRAYLYSDESKWKGRISVGALLRINTPYRQIQNNPDELPVRVLKNVGYGWWYIEGPDMAEHR